MRNKLVVFMAVLAIAAMAVGCTDRQGDVGNRNIKPNSLEKDRLTDKRFADDSKNNMNRVNGRRMNTNNVIGNHQNYRIELSEKVAHDIVGMKEVESAYVMLGDKNAYVAVSLNGTTMNKLNTDMKRGTTSNTDRTMEVTDELKERVAKEVKRSKPSIQTVYVSANPDFIGRMDNYMQQVRMGKPIQGFITEFNAMVDRIFPINAENVER
ncbi:YhcN/YlaJ family sporulation lipoprotein [Paenibacillaceae bacterium]|nr:YhcN/YlaJ family sporulation lipoprotein [Paenibacillaceae bacterium]